MKDINKVPKLELCQYCRRGLMMPQAFIISKIPQRQWTCTTCGYTVTKRDKSQWN